MVVFIVHYDLFHPMTLQQKKWPWTWAKRTSSPKSKGCFGGSCDTMQSCESESGWPQNSLHFEWHDVGSVELLLLQVLLRVLQNSRPISSWRLISSNINKRFHQKCTCFPIYIHLNVNCNFLKVRNCCCKLLGFAAVRPNCKFYTPAEEQQLPFPKLLSSMMSNVFCVRVSHPSTRNIESTDGCNANVSFAAATNQ